MFFFLRSISFTRLIVYNIVLFFLFISMAVDSELAIFFVEVIFIVGGCNFFVAFYFSNEK